MHSLLWNNVEGGIKYDYVLRVTGDIGIAADCGCTYRTGRWSRHHRSVWRCDRMRTDHMFDRSTIYSEKVSSNTGSFSFPSTIRENYKVCYGEVSSGRRRPHKFINHGYEAYSLSFLLNPKGEDENEQSTNQVANVC